MIAGARAGCRAQHPSEQRERVRGRGRGGREEGVPGHGVPHGHFVEHPGGVLEAAAAGVHGDKRVPCGERMAEGGAARAEAEVGRVLGDDGVERGAEAEVPGAAAAGEEAAEVSIVEEWGPRISHLNLIPE
jgi:hypothetical protein